MTWEQDQYYSMQDIPFEAKQLVREAYLDFCKSQNRAVSLHTVLRAKKSRMMEFTGG